MSGIIKGLVNGDARYAIGRVFMGGWWMVDGAFVPLQEGIPT